MTISHCGAGTLLEALRAGATPIACINTTLMDNHQSELADSLSEGSYLVKATVTDVLTAVEKCLAGTINLKEYPAMDEGELVSVINEMLLK